MKLIIDIPEKLACEGFERPFTDEEVNILLRAIGNGTPLPKGHRDLIDRKEIDNMIKEIREYCKNNNCKECEAYTIHGCVFMSSFPNEWFTTEEADKEEQE